jgi:hypothetical protein
MFNVVVLMINQPTHYNLPLATPLGLSSQVPSSYYIPTPLPDQTRGAHPTMVGWLDCRAMHLLQLPCA